MLNNFDKKYHKQILANFPKTIVDTSGGISVAQKQINALSMVKYFNSVFNNREKLLDRKHGNEEPTQSEEQFIDDSGVTPKKQPIKKKKKRSILFVFFSSMFFCCFVKTRCFLFFNSKCFYIFDGELQCSFSGMKKRDEKNASCL